MEEGAFRANDIRGKYPDEVNEALFYHIGLALPKIIKGKKIAIGRDIRLSSNSLFTELVEGLNDRGINVLDLGLCDTPYTYFISGRFKLPCLMITASHNPKEYNGLKIILPGVKTLSDKQIKILLDEIKKTNKISAKKGGMKLYNKRKEYVDFILKQVNKKSLAALKIVIDCSNGMAETLVPALFAQTPAKVTYINKKADGTFPSHLPNPAVPKNLTQLQEKVRQEHADMGIMFDGDCDRVAFVDEKGRILDGSITASIFAHYLLEKQPKKSIVHNTAAGMIFPETINLYGGRAILAKLGHLFMKEKMRKEKAIFGAEYTGHYYFGTNFGADSGPLAALLFYQIVSESKAPISLMGKTFEKYHSLGEIDYAVKDRKAAFDKAVSFIRSYKPDWESEIDGYAAKKKNKNGEIVYATVRISNTENLIRMTVESTSEECAIEFKKTMDGILV